MWMAPEVLTSSGAGNNLYSAKADVYSFAMLCVELITGENPYRGNMKLGNIRDHVVGKDLDFQRTYRVISGSS